ncbi:MAG: hypothetical protein WDZ57_02715 [Demequina sp.]
MTQPRLRHLFAATVSALALTLVGCAVPGQEAAPGVAAQYDGRTVTNAHVDEVYEAWVTDSQGIVVPIQRRSIITIELLGPTLIAESEAQGFLISDSAATDLAREWISLMGGQGEPSPQTVESVRAIFALGVLSVLGTEDGNATLTQIAEDVEANAVFSPRSGEFSVDLFLQSVTDATDWAISQQLGSYFYTAYLDVNGLVEPASPWIDRG